MCTLKAYLSIALRFEKNLNFFNFSEKNLKIEIWYSSLRGGSHYDPDDV